MNAFFLNKRLTLLTLSVFCFVMFAGQSYAQKKSSTINLNGIWEVEEGIDSLKIPQKFKHNVEVPGLTNQAKPAFVHVDMYNTPEMNFDLKNVYGPLAFVDTAGYTVQKRKYFWYKRNFNPGKIQKTAFLQINKAQFGSSVWINGKQLGGNFYNSSSKKYNISSAIQWGKENSIVIRIGAHPGVLPKDVPYGIDYEKYRWTPGIYDDVSLHLSENPVIEQLQIAPNIHNSTIVVQSIIVNYSAACTFTPTYEVKEWKSAKSVSVKSGKKYNLAANSKLEILDTINVPNAKLWNTTSPFLYSLDISTGGDDVTKRFGMREFRFDTPTKRAYLNDTMIYLRGSNIALHRFFEDPKCGSLPWNEKWVRKLLAEIPKSMDWNSFRFTIGAVPDKWFDIADEEGILIQPEYFIWTMVRPDVPSYWSMDHLYNDMKGWMTDIWNHPSVVIWDALNETRSERIYQSNIVNRLRALDLSNRTWESSYNNPSGPNDPVEFHPYLMHKGLYHWNLKEKFSLRDLENRYPIVDSTEFATTGHPMILNEYGWLWLNRDGSPTFLVDRVYDKFLGKNRTIDENRKFYAYALSGLTEYFRAYRMFAGVQYFVYLTSSQPQGYTSDNFIDINTLELEPYFKDYMHEAFKPVGVYLNFWQPTLKAKESKRFKVMMINDKEIQVKGNLELSIVNSKGEELLKQVQPFQLEKFGQQTFYADVILPDYQGDCVVKATAKYNNLLQSTVSRRNVKFEK